MHVESFFGSCPGNAAAAIASPLRSKRGEAPNKRGLLSSGDPFFCLFCAHQLLEMLHVYIAIQVPADNAYSSVIKPKLSIDVCFLNNKVIIILISQQMHG